MEFGSVLDIHLDEFDVIGGPNPSRNKTPIGVTVFYCLALGASRRPG